MCLDYCLPTNPCQNSGRCISNTISYQCDCTGTGYTGTICTDIITIGKCSLTSEIVCRYCLI